MSTFNNQGEIRFPQFGIAVNTASLLMRLVEEEEAIIANLESAAVQQDDSVTLELVKKLCEIRRQHKAAIVSKP